MDDVAKRRLAEGFKASRTVEVGHPGGGPLDLLALRETRRRIEDLRRQELFDAAGPGDDDPEG